MHNGPRPMAIPDPQALAAQGRVIEAQKELNAIQIAQSFRQEKAKTAINFILLPLQTSDGVVRQEPENTKESKAARAATYRWLEKYFTADTDFEAGIPVREVTAVPEPIARA